METQLRNEARLSVDLKLNEDLRLGLSILQKPILDLLDFIEHEAENNPFLEFEYNFDTIGITIEPDLERYVSPTLNDLKSYLHERINLIDLKEENEFVVSYIIDNLDEKGFLPYDVEEIADELDVPVQVIERNLKFLKENIEPYGCGSRNFLDYLSIFLDSSDLDRIKDCMKSGVEIPNTVKSKLTDIPPYPAWGFDSDEAIVPVIPEVIVEKKDGSLEIEMPEFLKLRIDKELEKLARLNNWKPKEYSKAKVILTFFGKRKEMIYKIAQLILKKQVGFLSGKEDLKPFTLTEAANILGLSVSTVSRAVSGKFIYTPVGTFKLKDMFSRKVGRNLNVSTHEIERKIYEILRLNMNMSDEKIRRELRKEGVFVSRRTITKYRLKMGIRRKKPV